MTHKDWSNYAGGAACFLAGFLAMYLESGINGYIVALFLFGSGLIGENSIPELFEAVKGVKR